ncbi:hypothetical protein [Longibaculum muris]|uniref:hypothetical protein n=1 Tax=Longibaculum muris TaxID=1796628 RepID=UPI0022E6C4EC|nr:hypothetical protein [Longibaculum muris]
MWIRSQDKEELVKCNSVYYTEEFCLNEGNYLVGLCDGLIRSIGQYSTKEKALKVLDMIQNYFEINKKCIFQQHDDEWYCFNEDVFQMPQDDEVIV